MSERPTETLPSRAAAALGRGYDERGQHAGAPAGAGRRSVAERAASFRDGAPFLVERATLYDPEPLAPRATDAGKPAAPPRPLLPAALTLLGVVVLTGLAAAVLFVRNADVMRPEERAGRLELFSDRARPPEGNREHPGAQPNATTLAYDLTRRPNDVIVGAWRRAPEREGWTAGAEPQDDPPKRRPLPRRSSPVPPEMPGEAVTPSMAKAPTRYDPPEPKRRIGDSDQAEGSHGQTTAVGNASGSNAGFTEAAPAEAAERPTPSIVARVGRASEPSEVQGSEAAVPLDQLALPRRRPDLAAIEPLQTERPVSARARRARLLQLQRQLRREQRRALANDPAEQQRASEAAFGDWFVGTQRLRP